MSLVRFRPEAPYADLAHLVERDLAKVEVAGSSPVIRSNGLVVQLVRTLACHARGQGFESPSGRHFASVAQLVEQGTENPRVTGSIPVRGTKESSNNESFTTFLFQNLLLVINLQNLQLT